MDADTPEPPRSGLDRMLAYLRGDYPPGGMVALLGMRPIAVERGKTVFEAVPAADHTNSGGSVHGGYTSTLLDTVMGCAALTVVGPGKGVTTLELKISFQRAIVPPVGRIIAYGTVISHGRRAVFTEARLTDEAGKTLATGSSTLLVLER